MNSEMPRPPALLVTVVPYVLLAALVGYTALTGRGVELALLLAAGAWMLGMFTLRPGAWERLRPMAVYFAGLLIVTTILVLRDPAFGFFTPVAYIYAYAILPWPWQVPAVGLVAVVAGVAQASGVDGTDARGVAIYAAIVGFNIVIMVSMAWALRLVERRQLTLAGALAELGRANHLLEATAAENAALHDRLLAQAREAGVLEERRRMAREIHDTVAQGLTGIIAQLQAAEQVEAVPEPWRRHTEAAQGLARQSLTEARRSVDALRPEPLETTGHLGDALAEVAERWSALQGVPVRVTTTGEVRPMPAEAEFVLLRTAQEALANVARHAEASRVGLTLSYLADEVALDVVDDGRGFDPDAVSSTSFGLGIMRQRLEGVSGTLRIESESGTGISARVPLPLPRSDL
ncbi:sensor histidine kinase [Actinoplanes awajinensis]|nr:sensor histidine kinase [Actinoplanes awajinensis]